MIISIIILNYKTKEFTLSLLDSLFKNYKKEIEENKIEIILADNASGDDSIASFKKSKHFLKIKIIENKENFGFSKGNNIAAKEASGTYLLFLNSDTKVMDKGFLKMTDFLDKNNNIGILGGKLNNENGSRQASCAKFYTPFNLLLMLLGLERFGLLRESPSEIKQVDWVSGACLMIKRSLFEKLKGFDESFFMYIEDMELCFRAKQAGFLTYFYEDIKLIHKNLGSSNKNFAILNIYKGLLYFYKKHMKNNYLTVRMMMRLKAKILNFFGKEPYGQALKILRQ